MAEELIDIYDEKRHKTGRVVARNGLHLAEGEFMLYALAVIEDRGGRLLITQRSLNKKWAAGAWEVPGGGVRAGETTSEAVVREVFEETGLDVSDMVRTPIYSYENVALDKGDNYFVDIYHFLFDFTLEQVHVKPDEVIGCALATWDDISALDAQGKFLHYGRIQQALGYRR